MCRWWYGGTVAAMTRTSVTIHFILASCAVGRITWATGAFVDICNVKYTQCIMPIFR